MSSDQSAERRNDEATRSVKIQFHSILLLGTNVHERQVFRVDNTAATFFFSFNFSRGIQHISEETTSQRLEEMDR